MIHEIITCDICNPQDGTKGIVRLPYPNEGQGIFEGSRNAASNAGWVFLRNFTSTTFSANKKDICPECIEEGD